MRTRKRRMAEVNGHGLFTLRFGEVRRSTDSLQREDRANVTYRRVVRAQLNLILKKVLTHYYRLTIIFTS